MSCFILYPHWLAFWSVPPALLPFSSLFLGCPDLCITIPGRAANTLLLHVCLSYVQFFLTSGKLLWLSIANAPPSFQGNPITEQRPHKKEPEMWLTHKKHIKTKQIMTGLCIPVGWFCGLLVSQAAQCLLVLSSFSSSSSVHWPGEGADSLLCVESNLFFLVYLLLSSSGSIFLLCPSGFCFLSLSLAIPVCFLPVSFCYSLGLLLSLFWRDL